MTSSLSFSMQILAIDTATESCSVALYDNGRIEQQVQVETSGHSKRVLDMCQNLLASNQLQLGQLDGIAVDNGPGAFTGVRIGIGVAQGLAYGSGIKVIGISSLQVLAADCNDNYVVATIDARMHQIYWAVYKVSQQTTATMTAISRPKVSSPQALIADLSNLIASKQINQLTIVGNGWHAYQNELSTQLAGCLLIPTNQQFPLAKNLCQLAVVAGKEKFVRPSQLFASYVRNKVAVKTADRK